RRSTVADSGARNRTRAGFMDGLDLQRAAEKERLYGAARNGTRADCLSGRVAGRASERRASGSEALRSDAERYPGCDPLFYEAGKQIRLNEKHRKSSAAAASGRRRERL